MLILIQHRSNTIETHLILDQSRQDIIIQISSIIHIMTIGDQNRLELVLLLHLLRDIHMTLQ